jgi:hypothetical protein
MRGRSLTPPRQVWGITIGGTVLQNQLLKRLPAGVLSQIPGSEAVAYQLIPVIKTLAEPLRSDVRQAFADSLQDVWKVMAGIAGVGLLASLLMKRLPLGGAAALPQEEDTAKQ